MSDKPEFELPLMTRLRSRVHRYVVEAQHLYYTRVWKMQIGTGCRISMKAKLDKTNPRGLVIGDHSFLTFGATVLTHDFVNREHKETRIGSYTFIGCNAVILAGVTIGDHCIIGAGTLVREDVPDRCIVAGNPGRIVRRGIDTIRWGMIPREWEERIPLKTGETRDPATGRILLADEAAPTD